MKTLRYLLMVMTVALMSVTAQAQPTTPFRNSQNQAAFSTQQVKTKHYATYATSTLMESGSNLPMAARNGVTIGENTPDDNTSLSLMPRPRRVGEDDEFEDEPNPETPSEPNPVGDGVWVLLLLAFGLMCYRMARGAIKRTISLRSPQNQSDD